MNRIIGSREKGDSEFNLKSAKVNDKIIILNKI